MWMQNVAAAWLMTSLTTSAALVALVQTAISLPFFIVAIPAGALADVVDRRRLLLAAQAWMFLAAVALGALAYQGALEPWSLLALTFALGLGAAVATPASQALTPELVTRDQIPAAIMLSSAGFNVARAVGPALGGFAVAAAGASLPFFANALAFAGVFAVIAFLHLQPSRGAMPPEHLAGAMRAGLRYARHAGPLRVVLVRTGVCLVFATALWALLPIVARDRLGLGSAGYGVMLGCFGAGAVAGSGLLHALRRRYGMDAVVAACTLVFAAVIAASAFVTSPIAAGAAFLVGGVAWIGLMSSFNTAAQLTAASWVRARALSSYLLVSQGALALGSAIWGIAAARAGTEAALLAAAGLLALTALAVRRFPLDAVVKSDLTAAAAVHAPEVAMAPEAQDGPVLVSVRYRVRKESAAAFAEAMNDVRAVRRRDGAYAWGLFRDLDDDASFVESFLVESWDEHVRQHGRATVADHDVEARVKPFLDGAPEVSHLIDAGAGAGRR
jgi:predicted MFS family arabinose efflux permease